MTPIQPLLHLLSGALLTGFAIAQGYFNPSIFPTASQGCMSTAAVNSGCNLYTDSYTLDYCLCASTNFLRTAAICVNSNDPDDLHRVYQAIQAACASTNTPLEITFAQFSAAASGQSSSFSTASSPTQTTQPAAPTGGSRSTGSTSVTSGGSTSSTSDTSGGSSSGGNTGGLSAGAIAGISVAGSLAGIVSAVIAVYLCCCRRGRG